MRARRLVVVIAVVVACRDAEPARDPHVAARPSPTAVAPPPDAGLVFIQQTEASDCGPAAIAMTLSYYGRPTTLDASKAATHFHADGTTALDLVQAAEAGGLGATGIAAEADAVLPVLRTGDILHFDFNHFVVFDALVADGVRLVDPSEGHQVIDRAAFAQHFTGVALLFERSPAALEARKRSIHLAPAAGPRR